MRAKYLNFKFIFSLFLLFNFQSVFANGNFLSDDLENTIVSLITCDPGDEIYSHFGHSAIRIQNNNKKIDLVVNWGLFSFSDGQLQFGYDFAKGRLKYFMGFQKMDDFLLEYKETQRGVSVQELNFNSKEKKEFLNLIDENYKPENREYRYEFFYDNCSSRIRDLIIRTIGNNLKLDISLDSNQFTFRDIIHSFLKNEPWLNLGIDLVLGKRIDVFVDNYNLMFLPKYLAAISAKSLIKQANKSKSLISKTTIIIPSKNKESEVENIVFFSWISLIVTLSLLIIKRNIIFNIWSTITLTIIGVLGIILVFMWFGTDHQATKYNLNLLWATPFHLYLIAIIILKKWNKFSYWFILCSLSLLFLTVLFWFTLSQELNPFIKPVILQLGLIYYYYLRKNKNVINLT
jgi:hypothetical protein